VLGGVAEHAGIVAVLEQHRLQVGVGLAVVAHGFVQLGDVGLVVLAVVEVEGLGAQVRGEVAGRVRERGECEGHGSDRTHGAREGKRRGVVEQARPPQ
jgi:hypothetical protein